MWLAVTQLKAGGRLSDQVCCFNKVCLEGARLCGVTVWAKRSIEEEELADTLTSPFVASIPTPLFLKPSPDK